MGMTPLAALKTGSYIYLILPALVGLVTYFSFKMNNNTSMTDEQAKQMDSMFEDGSRTPLEACGEFGLIDLLTKNIELKKEE